MADLTKHSEFDNMSTAELNEYLRQDSYCADSATDDVLYVMELLERREKEENTSNLPDVQKAWAEFQKYYNTEDNDAKPLHDFDDEPTTEITNIKKARKGLSRTVKSLISVAAVICVILVGSFTAKGLGWDAIAVWTKNTFHFERTVNEPMPTPYAKQIPEELTELKSLMIEHSLSYSLIPGYIPEGYKTVNLQYNDLDGTSTVFCQLSNGSHDIILLYIAHSEDFTSLQLEKDDALPEKYEHGGITYYLMSNMGDYLVTWLSDNVECTITGIPSHDEAVKMINSLGPEQ